MKKTTITKHYTIAPGARIVGQRGTPDWGFSYVERGVTRGDSGYKTKREATAAALRLGLQIGETS